MFFIIFFSQSHLQRLTYLDDLDIDDRKKLSFYHVVPNSIFKVKWWPEWAPLIHAAYYGDVKGIWNILIRKCLKPRLAELITFRNRQKARACLSSTPIVRHRFFGDKIAIFEVIAIFFLFLNSLCWLHALVVDQDIINLLIFLSILITCEVDNVFTWVRCSSL